jgi:hypothetical protein
MDEDFQSIRMILKDVESTAPHDDTRLLLHNLTDGLCLRLKEVVRGLIVFQSAILRPTHIVTIEISEIVTPQGITGLDLLHGLLHNPAFLGHLIQDLLVEQLDIKATRQLCSNLMAACSELATDRYNELFFSVHNAMNF